MAGSPASSIRGGFPLGLAGAVVATRYVGGTAAVAPVAGTFEVGDFVITATGKVYVCTVAGTPGTWVQAGGSGTVTSVTAGDTSIVVGGTAADPTIVTATLDVIATVHPPAAAVPLNAKKITGLADGAAASDAAAFGQIPTALPPSGAAGGQLAGTYPNPTIGQAFKARNRSGIQLPTTAIAVSCDRAGIGVNNGILATARLQAQMVPVLLGDVITSMSVLQATTAFTAATNAWFALVDSALSVIRQSTDQLTAGVTALTLKTLALDSIPVTAGARVASSTVTLTIPTLSQALTALVAVGDSITVSNANIAAYNGTFTVVTVSATQITYVAGSSATDSLAGPFPTVQLAAAKRTYTVPADGYVYACVMYKGTVGTLAGPSILPIAMTTVPIYCGSADTGLTGTCPSPIGAISNGGTLAMYAALS